jgi:hypothetical protein
VELTQIIHNYLVTGNLEIGTDLEFFYIGQRDGHFIPGDIYRVVSITNLRGPNLHVKDKRGHLVILSLKGFLELFLTKSEFRNKKIDQIL